MEEKRYLDHTFVICAYKESIYLRDCIESIVKQTVKSNIIITTSTPTQYVLDLGEEYGIEVMISQKEKLGIKGDFNFGLSCAKTQYVTLVHQDDLYDKNYLERVMEILDDGLIICFTDYAEYRDGEIISKNKVLKVKRFLLTPLKYKIFYKNKFVRRRVLSMGNSICNPTVTYNKFNLKEDVFDEKSDMFIEDWEAWERLSKQKGKFVFVPCQLVSHRIHEESLTTQVIGDNTRDREDFIMFCKFWPNWIAKILIKLYQKSQSSNNIQPRKEKILIEK